MAEFDKKLATTVLQNPIHFIAFGFGWGLSPVAPGTFGTIAAIPIYLMMTFLPPLFYLLLVALFFVAGIWLCEQSSKMLGVHDHSGIVWDEFVGFFVTMTFAPAGLFWIVLGFLLFRLFDIFKPFPINWLDKNIHGGLGIMLDDVVAGLFALVALQFFAQVL